jgi:hypothetical protein
MKLLRLALAAMIAFFTLAAPSRALDLTNYTPFNLSFKCTSTFASNFCTGAGALPGHGTSTIVVEYVSVQCDFDNDQFLVNIGLTDISGNHLWVNNPETVKYSGAKVATGGQVVRFYPVGEYIYVFVAVAPETNPASPGCTIALSGEQSPPTAN